MLLVLFDSSPVSAVALRNFRFLQYIWFSKDDIWFSKVPCGHNTLQKIVPELMKAAGVSGYFTNHSLHASAATRLFEGGVDEQLIMT